jgi:hypothetical protein
MIETIWNLFKFYVENNFNISASVVLIWELLLIHGNE